MSGASVEFVGELPDALGHSLRDEEISLRSRRVRRIVWESAQIRILQHNSGITWARQTAPASSEGACCAARRAVRHKDQRAPNARLSSHRSSLWGKQIHGAVDQLTAYFIVERQLAQRGTCTLTVPVFDGSALHNLRFTDVEREILYADGH
jgi:hypothetical protein